MSARPRRAGLTLVELLVAAVMMAILSGALAYGFVAGLDLERQQTRRSAQQDTDEQVQRRITRWLQGAFLSEDAADAATYFVGETVDAGGDLGCDRLTFTSVTPVLPLAAQASDADFETQQRTFGPAGGIAEVSLSTTPTPAGAGEAGERRGLFERIQRPADSDRTQGGRESVLGPEVEAIGFQFWDGTEWVDAWDTTSGTRRLPAAVQVQYRRVGEPQSPIHRFLAPIPESDVIAQNPVTQQGANP